MAYNITVKTCVFFGVGCNVKRSQSESPHMEFTEPVYIAVGH